MNDQSSDSAYDGWFNNNNNNNGLQSRENGIVYSGRDHVVLNLSGEGSSLLHKMPPQLPPFPIPPPPATPPIAPPPSADVPAIDTRPTFPQGCRLEARGRSVTLFVRVGDAEREGRLAGG
jgi:hypothetical protein